MKVLYTICLFIFIAFVPHCYPQPVTQKTIEDEMRNDPLMFRVRSHEPSFKGFKNKYLRQAYSTGQSFYKQKDQWRHIIDSMWGPGLPYAQKLAIFDDFTGNLGREFDGFQSLGITWREWDSLKNSYRSKITEATSRGRFSAIMSYLTYGLRDGHTQAWDDSVVHTPLNPGVPVLCVSGFFQEGDNSHFGAVLTPLPDSSLLVIKVAPSHPLNLKPGDIILGYENKLWKELVHELMDAEIPLYGLASGAASAHSHGMLVSAGMNWHLFDTIDVVQYSSGDTLHMSLQPMNSFSSPPMLNTEQVPVPGVPFPDFFNGSDVGYGTIAGTNVGYIYLYIESWAGMGGVGPPWTAPPYADEELYSAVDALKGSEALIIDLRHNYGGWALFDRAFDILFGRYILTIADAYRCNSSDQSLCPIDNATTYDIPSIPPMFERPIAVLLGPNCLSMGDVTASRLRYHDMVRYFGKSSSMCFGDNVFDRRIRDWTLHYSIGDMYRVNDPDVYLNRKEFPIDYPVWFNPDDVANGIDPVVQKAVEWINNSSYAHDVVKDKLFYEPSNDTIRLRAKVENPNHHPLSVTAYYRKGEEVLDSSLFYDDGLHRDSIAGDGIWGTSWALPNGENFYNAEVSTIDPIDTTRFDLKEICLFPTRDLISIDSLIVTRTSPSWLKAQVWVRNNGQSVTVPSVYADIVSTDPNIKDFNHSDYDFGDLPPVQRSATPGVFTFKVDASLLTADLQLSLDITSNGIQYWTLDFIVPLRITPTLSKSMIDFGTVGIGETKLDSVILRNPNSLNLNAVSASSDLPTEYTVVPSSAVIAPLDSQKFYITFNPTTIGVHAGHLIFSYVGTGSPVQMDIAGTFSPPSTQFAVSSGWNMVSIPMQPFSYLKSDLFSTTVSPAYTYQSAYTKRDTLSTGVGYWVKYATSEIAEIPGVAIFSDTFDVNEGWNMVGSISEPIKVTNIGSIPAGIITSGFYFYAGENHYDVVDTIKPGYGYWVKVNQTGQLILPATNKAPAANLIRIVAGSEQPPPPPSDGKEITMTNEVPTEYLLEQNYPNPFNPATTIRYGVPERSRIVIEIYNVLGQIVATVVNGEQEPGYRSVDWVIASGLGSGLYFYRLTASSMVEPGRMFVQVRKMILVK